MSNSSLISYTKLSPNHSGKRTKKIDTVTIHCMAGQLSVESCGALFAKSSRQASSNYGIGPDGRIALYVDEGNRSWCTSSNANDQRAVTIEVASERDTVERVVMAESGGESFEGQMLVAQCILNAAEKEGVQPSEAVVIYSYTSNRPDPTQSVKDAVAAVFDRGEVAIDAPVMYFYNPALVTSDWHESQIFVAEVGGHRFFAERSTTA